MCDGSGCGGRGPEAALMTSVCGDVRLPPQPKRKSKTVSLTKKKSATILTKMDKTRLADGINEGRII